MRLLWRAGSWTRSRRCCSAARLATPQRSGGTKGAVV
jgi:hypothetical protein